MRATDLYVLPDADGPVIYADRETAETLRAVAPLVLKVCAATGTKGLKGELRVIEGWKRTLSRRVRR